MKKIALLLLLISSFSTYSLYGAERGRRKLPSSISPAQREFNGKLTEKKQAAAEKHIRHLEMAIENFQPQEVLRLAGDTVLPETLLTFALSHSLPNNHESNLTIMAVAKCCPFEAVAKALAKIKLQCEAEGLSLAQQQRRQVIKNILATAAKQHARR